MLEEVVRQLSHDLSLAQIQQKASSSQDRGSADATKPQAGASAQEVKALNDRVRMLYCSISCMLSIFCGLASVKQDTNRTLG